MSDDFESAIGAIQRQMVERTEDAILRILTGAKCECGAAASHIELGPCQMQYEPLLLKARMTRDMRYRCAEHWPYGADVTVAETLFRWAPEGQQG